MRDAFPIGKSLIRSISTRARAASLAAPVPFALTPRELQVLALDAEQKKFQAGASTNYLVIQAQRDLATAEGGEVSALANYKRAQTQMELVTGQTLVAHNIKLEEARVGSVNRPPDIPRP